MKVRIDDVLCYVESQDDQYILKGQTYGTPSFLSMVEMILTPSQFDRFCGESSTLFALSKKKQEIFLKLIIERQNENRNHRGG